MRAGDLDRRITIQRATPTRDQFNNEILTWFDLVTVWASARPASVRERLAHMEVGSEIDSVFEFRWSPLTASVDSKDRIVFDGKIYDIVAPAEIDRRVGIRVKAVARTELTKGDPTNG
jgi:SPP1 family predicted phage head-tail adaptor